MILAGGKSRRMGFDKAEAAIGGVRMIDLVLRRLQPQADRILISGPSDYGLGLEHCPDAADFPPGPAAGIFSVARRLNEEKAHGFVTAPVDAPFLPIDLAERLTGAAGCAIGADPERLHPTFAFWTLDALAAVEQEFRRTGSLSLHRLTELSGAAVVRWPDAGGFRNINSLEDIERNGGASR